MINKFIDLIGFNDPYVHEIHLKHGIFSAKLWNVSNITFRVSLIFLIIGILTSLTYYLTTVESILHVGIIFLVIAQFVFWIGQFAIVAYQILRKDYLWALGSFFFFFVIFIYKYKRKNNL